MAFRNKPAFAKAIEAGAKLDGVRHAGRTLMHAAAAAANFRLIESLAEKGLDPNARDDNGDTPLHLAARGGYDATCRKLAECGADVLLPNAKRRSAVQLAPKGSQAEAILRVLTARAAASAVVEECLTQALRL